MKRRSFLGRAIGLALVTGAVTLGTSAFALGSQSTRAAGAENRVAIERQHYIAEIKALRTQEVLEEVYTFGSSSVVVKNELGMFGVKLEPYLFKEDSPSVQIKIFRISNGNRELIEETGLGLSGTVFSSAKTGLQVFVKATDPL